jgi:hypothetical protein
MSRSGTGSSGHTRTVSDEPFLTSERVNAVFRDCIADTGITVEGIVRSATFGAAAIDARRTEIGDMLAELPDQFRKSGGGGWSFLNACEDRYGRQWTGMHQVMEALFLLGIAAGLATEPFGREMREAMPGGMPFYRVEF